MYVKLFNRILDSSIADNRRLRHLFTDLLLCSDPDGNIMMTKEAIARKINADLEEVEWGISELCKPDRSSLHSENGGSRIEPLEGFGYGWRIINYKVYRDFKTSEEMRRETAERVKNHRARKNKPKRTPLKGELEYDRAEKSGESQESLDKRVEDHLPAPRPADDEW